MNNTKQRLLLEVLAESANSGASAAVFYFILFFFSVAVEMENIIGCNYPHIVAVTAVC
jgi:hypothetical protein